MAQKKRELDYVISGYVNSKFYKSIQGAQKAISRVSNALKGQNSLQAQSSRTANRAAASTGGWMRGTLALVGALISLQQIGSAISFGVNLAGQMEQSNMAFSVMLKSQSRAVALVKDLQGFAAQTPFEFPEVQQSARSLLAFGVGVDLIRTKLTMLGDLSAGIQVPLSELSEVYGKIKVQGRVFAEDINQLQGRGIPIVSRLAKIYGVAETKIRGMVEKGKVGFKEIDRAMQSLTARGGLFYKMMAKQATTLFGLWSTVKDTVGLALAGVVTEFMPEMKKALSWLIDHQKEIEAGGKRAAKELRAVFKSASGIAKDIVQNWPKIGPIVKTIIGIYAAWRTATMLLTAAQIALDIAMDANPIGLVVLAIEALLAVIVIAVMKWDKITAAMKRAWDWFVRFGTDGVGRFIPLVNVIATIAKHWDAICNAVKRAWGWMTRVASLAFLGPQTKSKAAASAKLYGGSGATWAAGVPAYANPAGKWTARAHGGSVFGGHGYLVGEDGPELFVPRRRGSIIPNMALAGAGGMTIQGGITVHLSVGPGVDPYAAGQQAGRGIYEELRKLSRQERRRSFED